MLVRSQGHGRCMQCLPSKGTSQREHALASELKSAFGWRTLADRLDSQDGDRYMLPDICHVPSGIVVEYDGSYWHKDRRAIDVKKTKRMQALGFTVIRVREAPLRKITKNDVLIKPADSIEDVAELVIARILELKPELHSKLRKRKCS
jgi:very-short-patch-repair endonuclease